VQKVFGTTASSVDGAVQLTLNGELDLAAVDDLNDAIAAALARPGTATISIDLQPVTFLDSTIVGVLVQGKQTAGQQGTNLTVKNPHGMPKQVLIVTGVYEALTDT